MPRSLLELLFPRHFSTIVEDRAVRRGLDPSFIYAVIREESRFSPGVRSGAAARGLMQLIPQTADAVAQDAGINVLTIEDLYDPHVNITLGTEYLHRLETRFGLGAETAGAYNAGETAAEKWRSRAGQGPPLIFLAFIEYKETARYVEKVLGSYWMYRRIHHGDERPWGAFFDLQ